MDNRPLARSLRALVAVGAAFWLYLMADNIYHLVLALRGQAWPASYGVFGRSVATESLILLALAAAAPILWDMWTLAGQCGRGFDSSAAGRLRRMGRYGAADTVLLALLVGTMLSERANRVERTMSLLQRLACRLDSYVMDMMALALAAAILTAALFTLGRLAEKASLEQAVNDLTI